MRVSERIDDITSVFLVASSDEAFRVFRGEQRAIGEIMLTTTTSGARECLGFAAFVARRADSEFSRWFAKLEQDVALVAAEPGNHDDRIVDLAACLGRPPRPARP